MAQPKRHHHIAQGIQRRFTDAEGLLHAFDKRRPERGVFATTPLNLFVEKDLYTIRRKDGSRNTDLEHWYSELEGAVTPLLDHIIASCLAGQKPGLPADAKQLWDTFFYHQQKRAPDVFVRLGLEEQFYKDLPRRIEDYELEHGPLTDEDRLHMADPAVLSRMLRHACAQARAHPGDTVMEILAARGLAFAVTPPNKAFILGDHPQARRGGSDIRQDNVELWMPIGSRVAVSPWGPQGDEIVVSLSTDDVRTTNQLIFANSNTVAACSLKLIRSLAGLNA